MTHAERQEHFPCAEKFVRLAGILREIVESSASWETKFELCFSRDEESLITQIIKTGYMPDYFDPDMNYEDDVLAFYRAVEEKAEELRKAFGINI